MLLGRTRNFWTWERTHEAKTLIDLFFLGQYVLVSLMVPSFAAGTITGEKERQTYEMLLASPMRPAAVVLGKLLASLCHLAVLVFCSLPIVMLCIPLGGKSFYEVLATYGSMAASVTLFGMICVAASSYFTRTIAALVVSYLVILPLALVGILIYKLTEGSSQLVMIGGFVPLLLPGGFRGPAEGHQSAVAAPARRRRGGQGRGRSRFRAEDGRGHGHSQRPVSGQALCPGQAQRPHGRRHQPDFRQGDAQRVVRPGHAHVAVGDPVEHALGPAADGHLPVYLAHLAPWYACYVVLFNVLVGPVFSAGSVTSERERQTLELLLTTTVSPWHILSGKLISGLRVSCVLTAFIIWPLLLAWLLPPWTYWYDSLTIIRYFIIVALTALTTTTLAMFCSVLFSRTSVSLMTTYVILLLLYAVPVAAWIFAQEFSPSMHASLAAGQIATGWGSPYTWLQWSTSTSPLAAAFSLPLTLGDAKNRAPAPVSGGSMPPRRSSRFTSCSTASCWARCYGCFIAAGECGRDNSPLSSRERGRG